METQTVSKTPKNPKRAPRAEAKTELLGDSSRIYIEGVNALGPLEKTIMEYVWAHGEATVPEIHKWMRKEGKELAYNTVMMTTTRLASKGYLNQDRANIMYVYTPKISESEYLSGIVRRVMEKLVEVDHETVIRTLANSR